MSTDGSVDMDALEGMKENVQKRKGGHSVKQLVQTETETEARERRARERASLEHAVALSAKQPVSDPLAAHVALLDWYRQNYHASMPKAFLAAQENAARLFRKDPRYTNDVRFVSLWLNVSKLAPEPEDVFKYLESNGIGAFCAVYYIEYANLLEIRGKFKECDAIFAKGIVRKAAPLETLQRKQAAFQQRMMMAQEATDDHDADLTQEPEQLAPIMRSALSASSSIRAFPKPAATSSYSSYSSFGASRAQKPAASSKSNAPSKISVFKDDDNSSNSAQASENTTAWQDYGTKASITKENTLQPEPWVGSKLPQQASKLSTENRVSVFSDEATTNPLSKQGSDSAPSVLQPSKRQDKSELVSKLLSNSEDTIHEPAKSMPPLLATPKVKPPTSQYPHEKFMFDLTKSYSNDREYSFEEIRARSMVVPSKSNLESADEIATSHPAPAVSATQFIKVSVESIVMNDERVSELAGQPAEVPQTTVSSEEESQPSQSEQLHKLLQQQQEKQQQQDLLDSSDSSDDDEDSEVDRELERLTGLKSIQNGSGASAPVANLTGFGSKARTIASPTVNTKAALADVYEMFNAKLPFEEKAAQQQQQHQHQTEVREVEEFAEEDSDDGDELVAVKTGVDNRAVWYEVEADETISKKVYKPQASSLKSAIFNDENGATAAPVSQKKSTGLPVFNDENAPIPKKKERKPLGVKETPSAPIAVKPATPVVDVRSPFFQDETPEISTTKKSPSPAENRAGNRSTLESSGSFTAEYNIAISSDAKPSKFHFSSSTPNMQSTPSNQLYNPHNRYFQSGDMTVSLDTDDEEAIKNHNIEWHHVRVPADMRASSASGIMTPIGEASFDLPHNARFSVAGLSTIGSCARYHIDDTMTSLGRMSGVASLRESFAVSRDAGAAVDRNDGATLQSREGDEYAEEVGCDFVAGGDAEHDGEVGNTLSSISMVSSRDMSSGDAMGDLSRASLDAASAVSSKLKQTYLEEAEELDQELDSHTPKLESEQLTVQSPDSPFSDKQTAHSIQEASQQTSNDDEIAVQIPNPCNWEVLEQLREAQMTAPEAPLNEMSGYFDCTALPGLPANITSLLEAAVKKSALGGLCQICLGPDTFARFHILKRVAYNGNGVAYSAKELKSGLLGPFIKDEDEEDVLMEDECDVAEDATNSDEEETAQVLLARRFILKLDQPANPWEFYMLRMLRDQIPERILQSVPSPQACFMFQDVSCTRYEVLPPKSVMDVIGISMKHGFGVGLAGPEKDGGVDELLVAFWTIELLRTLESVQIGNCLHGNVRPETVLVRLGQCVGLLDVPTVWNAKYDASGGGGWSAKGIVLSGFSDAVDTFAFIDPEQTIIGALGGAGEPLCWEDKMGKPKRFEPDWFGAANVVHWLLFGKVIDVKETPIEHGEEEEKVQRPTMNLTASFKRHWQVKMWERLFDVLLNLETAGDLVASGSTAKGKLVKDLERDEAFADLVELFPAAFKIRGVRYEMEEWLAASCSKGGKSLKSLLQRVEMACMP
ncbi:hypothetical protein HDU80_003241 [Chytriomyces hyalinus]|nr:hypothetical protein HDU80_003241 [Chytriomyces hyalinus]